MITLLVLFVIGTITKMKQIFEDHLSPCYLGFGTIFKVSHVLY